MSGASFQITDIKDNGKRMVNIYGLPTSCEKAKVVFKELPEPMKMWIPEKSVYHILGPEGRRKREIEAAVGAILSITDNVDNRKIMLEVYGSSSACKKENRNRSRPTTMEAESGKY